MVPSPSSLKCVDVPFRSEKSLRAPGGINCRVSGIDQPPFQPSADTLGE